MAFNIEAYTISRRRMIEELKKRHKYESLLLDGVICSSVFVRQPIRILCVLAEPYGYQGEDIVSRPDVEDMLNHAGDTENNDVLGLGAGKVKAPKWIATLLLLIQQTLKQDKEVISREEWRNEWPYLLSKDVEYEKKLTALSKVAWVNLKKVCNPESRLVSADMRDHARENKDLLTEQIKSIDPHVSLVCGCDAITMAIELQLFGPDVASGKPNVLQATGRGGHVIEICHPSAPGQWNYEKIYDCYTNLYAELKKAGY